MPSLSIRNRIALLVVAVVCGLTAALVLLARLELQPELRREATQRLEERARYIARDLAHELAGIARHAGPAPTPGEGERPREGFAAFPDGIEAKVEGLAADLAAELGASLAVVDRGGRVRFGRQPPAWLEGEDAADGYAIAEDHAGHAHVVISAPIRAEAGADPGWSVAIASDLDRIESPSRRLELLLFTAGGLAALATLGLALPVAAAITRPIDVLVRAAEAYAASGELPALATRSFPPELERLGQALRTLVVVLHRGRKELQQSRGRLVQALAAGRQIAWEYGIGQSTTRIEAFEGTWLGWDAAALADATGADWLAFVHPDERAYVAAAMAGFIASGDERIILQYRMRAKDGSHRWVEDHALVVERDADGQVSRLAGTAIDIDEQKVIEQRLRESEARATLQLAELEAIYDQAPFGLLTVDREFRYLRVNPRLAAINGIPAKDHLGRTLQEMLPGLWPVLEPICRRVRETGEPMEGVEIEAETPAAPGVQRAFVVTYFPVKDAQGVVAIGAMVEDVTARKRAEAAERAKSAFLATMSHEIRTPLTAVLGFADLLAAAELGREQRHQVGIIRETGRMLLAIINDILDFSKLEAGKASLETAPFALRELLSGTFEAAKLLGAERGLAFRLEIDDAVPERVAGDATRLKQILTNLLGNAAKFTERGGIALRAALADRGEGKALVRFEVEDTGIGIAPERLPRLFAMFEQADQSITRRFGGTGLGLAICKRLAELMGGRIGARSAPGVGSTFWVELPLALPAPERDARPASAPIGVGTGALRCGRILVVDDVATNRLLLGAVLRGHGQEVALACDGVEAVETASRERFDLILMDVHMPRQDGLAATRAIREGGGPNAGAPIVALTAAVLAEEVAACGEAGMVGYLAKPIDPERLASLLATYIGLRTAA